MDIKTTVALIAAFASLAVALIGAVVNILTKWKFDRDLEALKADFARQKETMKAELAKEKSSFDARLQYEFEARKRLYEQCEPLLFQAFSTMAGAERRIRGIAKDAAAGHLTADPKSWLRDKYYLQSTVYRLFKPLVSLESLKRRMSQIDLSLDSNVAVRIAVLETLGDVLNSEFQMARADAAPIPYDPHSDPEKYPNQGLVRGEIDDIVAFMTKPDGTCMSWNEFEVAAKKKPESLTLFEDMLKEFHPRRSPVLWRILVGYGGFSQFAIARNRKQAVEIETIFLSETFAAQLDWRDLKDKASPDYEEVISAIKAASQVVQVIYRRNLQSYGVEL